ncbi:MAG TPA: exosortase system-associated protein, TIGR04073 family [Verrucomicrobiae bacterium]|jgi:putative exosortase-associated protein (TIGR04073 family)|nr:exosortase system-associated protein, TIGR04073 family [Verrucomicrobiae bacterium]
MRNLIPFLAAAVLAGLFTVGCAGPEEKLGRGFDNTFEFVRLGEMRRSVEQTAVFDSPNQAYTTGLIHGFDRSVERTGVGLWEVVSFPFPNHKQSDYYDTYGPIDTARLTPGPVYPESYKPHLISSGLFDTDTYTGFSGGDVAPFIPGSRFRIFDN